MTLQPGNTLGNYQIVEKIGAGGMGAVYKAYQPALGRYVAIKVLPPQTAGDPAFAERFAQEARAVGKLRHPNIVTAFDFTQHGDIAYLVSDYIDGGTLADQLGAPLPLEYVIGILTPIASALDYAHARGVVHRDIKPMNVLLTHDGTPVLTDFGLAKIVGPGSGMTQAGSLMGTAEYMAPELASGAEMAGPAADQYALGLIAYQMLVGRHPFPADNPLSALMAHVHKPVPIPSQLGVVLPPGVEAALLRSLAKKPEDRFARAGDFIRALAGSRYVAPAPVPPSFAAPSVSPSQPPTPAPAPSEPAVSPLLSPSALVRPVARVAPPPGPAPAVVASPATGGTATAAVIALPRERRGFPWRRAIIPALLVLVLAVLAWRGLGDRAAGVGAGRTSTPQRTAPLQTTAPTKPPTVAPTAAPTARPTITVAPVDDYANNPAGAIVITPGTHSGTIAPAGDVDFMRIQVLAGTAVAIELRADTLPGGAVALINTSGNEVADEVNTGPDHVAKLAYLAREAGAYFIRIRGVRPELAGTYTISYSTSSR